MLLKSNTAVHGCAIGVHVENGKENSNAFAARFQKFLFVDFLNVDDRAVRRRNHGALIGGIWPVWITEKSDGVENQRNKKKGEPPCNEGSPNRQENQSDKDPATLIERLKAHDLAIIFRPKKPAVKPAKTESQMTQQRPQQAELAGPSAQPLGFATRNLTKIFVVAGPFSATVFVCGRATIFYAQN